MNPIFLSALQGFVKGFATGKDSRSSLGDGYAAFGAPIVEETLYRGIPGMLGGFQPGLTAAAFAAHHVLSEKHSVSSGLGRFADVMLGGILYEQAYAKWGLFGAIAGHVVHNVAVRAGRSSAPHAVRRKRRR